MKRDRYRSNAIYCLVAMFVVSSTIPPEILAGGWPFYEPGQTTTIDHLAKKIDQVQRRLDDFGTIVAKSPDVWGESRLLAHRDEFEREMKTELTEFRETLQGAESTRDSAFLASALSLSNVLGGETGGTETTSNTTQVFVAEAKDLVPSNDDLNKKGNNLVERQDGFGPKFANQFTTGVTKDGNQQLKISLEPTVYLDQKKRYLDHLHALRRLNEGDDTADSPGYALNLIRIPVSVMPGRKTRKGYGAQVSITIDPYASDELLPEAFRNFVINGVVDRIAPAVMRLVRDEEKLKKLKKNWKIYKEEIRKNEKTKKRKEEAEDTIKQIESLYDSPDFELEKVDDFLQQFNFKKSQSQQQAYSQLDKNQTIQSLVIELNSEIKVHSNSLKIEENAKEGIEKTMKQDLQETLAYQLSSHGSQTANRAYPPSLANAVAGTSLASVILATEENLNIKGEIHLEDVRRYLKLELQASYDLLSQPNAQSIWNDNYFMDELKNAIIEVQGSVKEWDKEEEKTKEVTNKLSGLRKEFYKKMEVFQGVDFTATQHLGWHILVESVMLNERLTKDIKSVAANKNCCQAPVDGLSFYGPNPTLDARYAFKEYVSCRWPIQVFALDPVTDDQNIGEAFSQRRELQLALAVAASQGIFGMQSLTRFVRRMEYDLETIQLNRTSVGFSHGNDTFGWRFYPRVQVPPVPGSVKAFCETLVGGQSREKRLREAMLEPATRECSALVVMPSFIPYVLVDVQTNWFKLAPSLKGRVFKRQMDLSDAVGFSRDVTSLRQLASACKEDEHLYRNGETHRLLRAVRQLERQLPLQTSYVQIPYENNLSGFQLFNNGVTDLGPELIDWYGGPGILVSNEEVKKAEEKAPPEPTTLFLVGKNFTSLGSKTKIIVGGIDVSESVKFVSRSVIQVTIPSNVLAKDKFVDVHLATPYGVTSHLSIPVVEKEKTTEIAALEAGLKKLNQQFSLQLDWEPATLDGCIDILNASSPVVNLTLSDGAKIGIVADVLPTGADKLLFAANVEVSADGKKFVPLSRKDSLVPLFLKYELKIEDRKFSNDGKTVAECTITSTDLTKGLKTAFKRGNYVKNDIKTVRLTGRAQLFISNNFQPLPVYVVNKQLTINMKPCTECKECPEEKKKDKGVGTAVPPAPPELFTPQPQPLFVKPKAPAAAKAPTLFRSSMTTPPASRPLRMRRVVPVRHQSTAKPGFTVLK